MAVDPRQFLLLGLAFVVPVTAFLLNRSRFVLGWVGFTLFVQIFDTTILTNLPAGRLVGLLFLPSAATLFRQWIRLSAARAWLINFCYLVILGVLFGYVMPWPDISGTRPFALRAEGRTIIYLIRTLSDLSLGMFVMDQLRQAGAFEILRQWMLRGAVVSIFAAVATRILNVDIYTAITGLREYAASADRLRGLTFEPRGLGLACAYALILILGKQTRRPHEWLLLVVIAAGLPLSTSTSGLAAAFAGLIVIMVIGSMRMRFAIVVTATLVLIAGAAILSFSPTLLDRARTELETRLKGRGIPESNEPANRAEELAYRLDVFDSSAALFLLRNPRYAVIGTGPGLMSLPASAHVPNGTYRMIFPVINNPPSHGILLELANTGIIGVATWIYQILSIFFLGRRLRRHRRLPFLPKAATTIFAAAAVIYAVQNGPVPFFAVFLGVGWAIAQAQVARAPGVAMPNQGRAHHGGDAFAAAKLKSEPAQDPMLSSSLNTTTISYAITPPASVDSLVRRASMSTSVRLFLKQRLPDGVVAALAQHTKNRLSSNQICGGFSCSNTAY